MIKFKELHDGMFLDGVDEEFYSAVHALNHFIKNDNVIDYEIVGYHVVRYEGLNRERTYILIKYTESTKENEKC